MSSGGQLNVGEHMRIAVVQPESTGNVTKRVLEQVAMR